MRAHGRQCLPRDLRRPRRSKGPGLDREPDETCRQAIVVWSAHVGLPSDDGLIADDRRGANPDLLGLTPLGSETAEPTSASYFPRCGCLRLSIFVSCIG